MRSPRPRSASVSFAPMPAVLVLWGLYAVLLPGQGATATWAEAVESALAVSDPAARAGALRNLGEAVRRQARSLTAEDPAARLKTLTDRLTENDGAYEVEAMLDFPLWLPGQRNARLGLAETFSARADALERYLRWETAGEVREAVWDAALAQGRLHQAAAALAAARSLEDTVARRVAAGEEARMDLLTARRETQTQAVALTAAQGEYDRAIADFVQLTGQPELPNPLQEPEPGPEPGPGPPAGASGGGPSYPGAAALPEDHPLLASAGLDLAQAQAERERVRSERRGHPVLSLGGVRVRDDRAVDATDAIQLELSVPFGLRRHNAPALAGAEAEVTDQAVELRRARREAERALTAAMLARRGAGEVLTESERRAALAEEALAVTRRAFALGEADLGEVLRAEERAREARLDLSLRRLEQGRAVSRLRQALGIVPE